MAKWQQWIRISINWYYITGVSINNSFSIAALLINKIKTYWKQGSFINKKMRNSFRIMYILLRMSIKNKLLSTVNQFQVDLLILKIR